MRGRAILKVAIPGLAAALAGCSALSPFPTFPQAAVKSAPAADRVALCYDGLASSAVEVQKAAQAQCGRGTSASLVATDYHLDYCPLLLPSRATFVCLPQQK